MVADTGFVVGLAVLLRMERIQNFKKIEMVIKQITG
jgi:hypothetical protein